MAIYRGTGGAGDATGNVTLSQIAAYTVRSETAETNAAASQAAAAISASNASTSASNASTSASNALTSENNAAASYDAFDDRYLGSKTSDPALDNDGNALLTGALYWNSVAEEMRVYTGSVWVSAYLPGATYLTIANNLSDVANAATALSNIGGYASSNPAGYTTNVGTVTSVSGTGSVNGLSIGGTVTTTGNITLSGSVTSVDTSGDFQMNSLGVGTAASATAGEIRATNVITAYYSDMRFKTKTGDIQDALEKVSSLNGFYFVENELAKTLGYKNNKQQVALSAQQVQKVLPEAVSLAPIDMMISDDGTTVSKSGENYLTVDYSKLVPLLVEAIKELKAEVSNLKVQKGV